MHSSNNPINRITETPQTDKQNNNTNNNNNKQKNQKNIYHLKMAANIVISILQKHHIYKFKLSVSKRWRNFFFFFFFFLQP